jgi:hypothetical protein
MQRPVLAQSEGDHAELNPVRFLSMVFGLPYG